MKKRSGSHRPRSAFAHRPAILRVARGVTRYDSNVFCKLPSIYPGQVYVKDSIMHGRMSAPVMSCSENVGPAGYAIQFVSRDTRRTGRGPPVGRHTDSDPPARAGVTLSEACCVERHNTRPGYLTDTRRGYMVSARGKASRRLAPFASARTLTCRVRARAHCRRARAWWMLALEITCTGGYPWKPIQFAVCI